MSQFFSTHLDATISIVGFICTTIFYLVLGGMAWQKINDRVDNHDDRIGELEKERGESTRLLTSLNDRLGRIETLVETSFKFIQQQFDSIKKRR